MLKTCYGLCSLRTGVKIVVMYELIFTILFFLGVFTYEMYNNIYPFYANVDVDVYYFVQSCVIIITLLKLFSAMALMQATFQNAPYKIFVWIVIDCVVYLTVFIVSVKLYIQKVYVGRLVSESATPLGVVFKWYMLAFIAIVNLVSIIEIHVVVSYYKEEKRVENAEQYKRMQTMMMLLKNRHSVDVFSAEFARSPLAVGLEEPLPSMHNLTSFKGLQPLQCV